MGCEKAKVLAAARCRQAEINNTVSCKQPVDDRKHVPILVNCFTYASCKVFAKTTARSSVRSLANDDLFQKHDPKPWYQVDIGDA